MSQAIAPDSAPTTRPSETTDLRRARPAMAGAVIAWAVAASLLLVGSSMVRSMQSQIYQEASGPVQDAPFPLSELPKEFQNWHQVAGSETVLDPLTTRITGSSDHAIGNYFDQDTGVTLLVMALYGPAEPVVPHIPEVCFPSSGFKTIGGPVDHSVPVAGHPSAMFRSGVFVKGGGRVPLEETVYYSFRHDGVWLPVVDTRNSPLKNPGIFKIQIQRRVAPGETLTADEPIKDFIAKMLPAFEKMIESKAAKPSAPPKAKAA